MSVWERRLSPLGGTRGMCWVLSFRSGGPEGRNVVTEKEKR